MGEDGGRRWKTLEDVEDGEDGEDARRERGGETERDGEGVTARVFSEI
jgi:hypothetical protein